MMLDSKGFDLWADGYDQSVGLCDESNEYPFAGYKAVLGKIFTAVAQHKSKAKVLDIGFGTAVLTSKLYELGHRIYGVDFSARMVEIAAQKMPVAKLYPFDIHQGLPLDVTGEKFHFIISTYTLHHLTDAEKVPFIQHLLDLLLPGGFLLIGDIAFQDRTALEQCKAGCGSGWDDDEFYFVMDEIGQKLPGNLHFEQVSICAGIISIKR